jgi:hypothetical protein
VAQRAEMETGRSISAKGSWATRKFPQGHEWYNCHKRQIRYCLIGFAAVPITGGALETFGSFGNRWPTSSPRFRRRPACNASRFSD